MPRVHGRIWIQTQIGLAPNLGFFHSSTLGINEALLAQDIVSSESYLAKGELGTHFEK